MRSSPAWVTLLRSAGAHDTYLRTYRGVLDASRVVEFMLLDRLFPRSVFYSLKLAEHSIDELLHRSQSRIGSTVRGAAIARAGTQRIGIRATRCAVESLDTGFGRACRQPVRDVGEALALQYFHVTPWVAWSDAGHRAQVLARNGEA